MAQRTAFVLAGGASLGAIEVGMLRALYERGITADVVVATSAGALNAAFIGSRPQTVETTDELADIWRGLRRTQVFPVNLITGLVGFLGASDHLVPDRGIRRLLGRHVERERLEDMPLELHVVAVDVFTGEEVLLSRGPTVEAVLASAAVPGVLPPVTWAGRELIDGGVADNTPISQAVKLGADVIYVLPTGNACALTEPPRSALAMALHALSLLTQRRLIDDISSYEAAARLVVLPPPCPLAVEPVDFSRARDLIEQGYADAVRFLDGGGAERPPIRMRMHGHAEGTAATSSSER